ncbi:MAG TPA: undecaprenyl-diphosphate phosphatase [Planctomycetaceae bacterium]|nr:undecaprenyl-diphosphate phosphatase [Planctomycetaceae bacterium]
MALLETILLAIVQGIGEFLPVSSSGHVVVLAAAFRELGTELGSTLTINIVLHLGTLAAIVVVYGRRIGRLAGRDRRVVPLLVVASIPAAVVGVGLKLGCKATLESPLLAGLMFPVTGVILLASARLKPAGLDCCALGYGQALVIGLFQALAILPGISRSGSTIVAGLACGLKREEAAAFSFLLAIPAIGGAGLLEALHWLARPPAVDSLGLLAVGGLLSFGVGLASLLWLLEWLRQGRLHHFAWWVLVLGPAVVVWQSFA